MFSQPIIAGTITGWLLGNWKFGLIIGSFLEILYAGTYVIGTATPLDYCFVTVFTVSFAVINSENQILIIIPSLIIAFLLSFLSKRLEIYLKQLNNNFSRLAEVYISTGSIKKVNFLIIAGIIIIFLKEFILCAVSMFIGNLLLSNIPPLSLKAQKIIKTLWYILPLLGIAVISNIFISKSTFYIFLIGFIITIGLLILKLSLPLIFLIIITFYLSFLIIKSKHEQKI